MALPHAPSPTLLLVAIFSRHPSAIEWARSQVAQNWGVIGLESPPFAHAETEYYATEMGQDLLKQFFVVDGLFAPERLAEIKLQSIGWEQELARVGRYAEARPVNIDPGYLTLSKFVLASAKDRAHRIYLSQGIYAEQCLYYESKRWQGRPWTYPDYQRDDVQAFLVAAREYLKQYTAKRRLEA